jgi:hypothetical protein
MAVMLGSKRYAAALVGTKVENPITSIGGPPFACGITKMLVAGSWVRISGSSDRVKLDSASELAVIDQRRCRPGVSYLFITHQAFGNSNLWL